MTSRRLGYLSLLTLTLGVYATMILWTLPRIAAEAGGLAAFDMRPAGYALDVAGTAARRWRPCPFRP